MNSIPSKLSDILFKLEFIGMIKLNQKVCMYDFSFVESNSIFGSIKRTIRNENRETNIKEIRSIINDAFLLINEYKDTNFFNLIIEKLNKSKVGISNLKQTYHDDPKMIGMINIILDDLNIQINQYTKQE